MKHEVAKSPGTAILRGYYGMLNTGDDAFLAVTAWAVQKFFHAENIFACTHRISKLLSTKVEPLYLFPRLRKLRWLNWGPEILGLRKAKYLIWGGGSIIHGESLSTSYCQMIDRATAATSFAAGVSIGPFPNVRAESSAARFLKRLAFVGVRDQISYERAINIAPDANIKLTFDLAPLLIQAIGDNFCESPVQPKGLGVALCNYERFVGGDISQETRRLAIVAEAIRKSADAGVIDSVVLIDFNGHPRYGDYLLHIELAHRLGGLVPVEHFRYCENPAVAMKRIGMLRGMIAMRLHAAVFAFCNSIPTVILCYHEKCNEWARMIRAPLDQTMYANELCPSAIAHQIERIFRSEASFPNMTPSEAASRSLSNWTWCQ